LPAIAHLKMSTIHGGYLAGTPSRRQSGTAGRILLNDRIAKSVPPKGRLEDCIELPLKFLSSPWNIWKNSDFFMRQAVLRLAFAEPLRYSQKGVYETQKLSFPFKYLG
jgi:site-specific DNA recombinase